MTEEEYIQERLEDQINWYSKKSQINQKNFKICRIIEIISAAIIPFLAGFPTFPCYSLLIGGLGVLIAVTASVSSLYKFQEHWIEYRTTCETLKHDKYLYQTKCAPYESEDAFYHLVRRVESLISKENTQWSRNAEKSNPT
jgi:hypothetical protein